MLCDAAVLCELSATLWLGDVTALSEARAAPLSARPLSVLG